jgi:16S rRNA (uracil1498-N3)-methyltransferase
VLRLVAGDRVRLFNGRGDEWDAEVSEASKPRVLVRLLERVTPAREPRLAITLAVAVLKGEKMDDVVRDAVMLGVIEIVPLITERTEVSAATLDRRARVARWQRIAVASAKQCGRAVVPVIGEPVPFETALARAEGAVMLVEPAADAPATRLEHLPALARVSLFVGPEGGWSGAEVDTACRSGAILLTLGALTLRADAMPIVALTALRVRLEDF